MRLLTAILLLLSATVTGQCPNDFCDTATELSLCAPASFDNYDCTDEQLCISPHPASGSCSYYYQYKSQWFTITITEAGLYTLELATNFTGGMTGSGPCTGPFQGSQWALSKASCTNWIVNSVNFNNQHLCFCPGVPFPSGAGASTSPCPDSPCGQAYQLGPYWQSVGLFPQDIGSNPPYQPYNPCRNLHKVEFYITPDIYYIQITSIGLSEGDGTIEVCGPWGPLCNKPVLTLSGTTLTWTEAGVTGYKLYRVDIITYEQELIWEGFETSTTITEAGYYYISSECGGSNFIHANIVQIGGQSQWVGVDVLGRRGVTNGIRFDY